MFPIVFVAALVGALPDLDVERVCRSGLAGKATEEYQACVDTERRAENVLREKWAQYPAKLRNECANVMRVAPESSYVELRTCIESQTGDSAASGATIK